MNILVTGGTVFVSRFAAEYFTKRGLTHCASRKLMLPAVCNFIQHFLAAETGIIKSANS